MKFGNKLISRSDYLVVIFPIVTLLIILANATIMIYTSLSVLEREHKVIDNIFEKFESSNKLLCSLTNCNIVISPDSIYISNDSNMSTPEKVENYSKLSEDIYSSVDKYWKISDRMYLDISNYRLLYKFKDTYIDVDTSKIIYNIIITTLIITTLVIIILFIVINVIIRHERNQLYYYLSRNTSNVQADIYQYLSMNIHHEMNSPLLVIRNRVEGLIRLGYHTEDVLLYIDQLFNIINNMKEFKRIKYSNGDKTLYDLCQSSINLINEIRVDKFDDVYIDDKLKEYKLNHNTILNNGDIVSNILNHIKNSLNANSTEFIIKIDEMFSKTGFLKILLIDNGNGIPRNIRKKLYTPNIVGNTSVKGEGMGLYLNNLILSQANGEDRLESTIVGHGTIFSILIPVTRVTYKDTEDDNSSDINSDSDNNDGTVNDRKNSTNSTTVSISDSSSDTITDNSKSNIRN